jgi:hypothetical protein
LLTDSEIIEVKNVIGHKGALGQIFFYADVLPFERKKRVHLFGHIQGENYDYIVKTMAKYDVLVTFDPEFCYEDNKTWRIHTTVNDFTVEPDVTTHFLQNGNDQVQIEFDKDGWVEYKS